MIKVTVWNENIHEKEEFYKDNLLKFYPKGIHNAIADFLNKDPEIEAKGVTLDMPSQGLPDEVLDNTDVLFWWAHQVTVKLKTPWWKRFTREFLRAWEWSFCTQLTIQRFSES